MINVPPGAAASYWIASKAQRPKVRTPSHVLYPAEAKTALWMERHKPIRKMATQAEDVLRQTAHANPGMRRLLGKLKGALMKAASWLRL